MGKKKREKERASTRMRVREEKNETGARKKFQNKQIDTDEGIGWLWLIGSFKS